MSRIPTLPGSCKSLTDTVRVVGFGVNGVIYPPMTLADAMTLATSQNAELVHLGTSHRTVLFRLVDEPLKKRLRKKKP